MVDDCGAGVVCVMCNVREGYFIDTNDYTELSAIACTHDDSVQKIRYEGATHPRQRPPP